MRRLRQLAELTDDPLVEMTQTDVERFLYDLSQRRDLGRGDDGWSDSTLQNNENALLTFLKEQVGRAWTDEIDRTSVSDTGIDPDDMLESDDIAALVDACRYQRDRALIEFLADTGARISLVCSLRVGDVDLGGERASYSPNEDAIGSRRGRADTPRVTVQQFIFETACRDTHGRRPVEYTAQSDRYAHFSGAVAFRAVGAVVVPRLISALRGRIGWSDRVS